MVKIGQKAPDFKCDAVINGQIKTITLDDLKGSYSVLFFYPLDFTFVCPTELHALQQELENFKSKNTQVFGISVDSVYSHITWQKISKNSGGIAGISYPLISDINKTMSQSYGVLDESQGVALRGMFILDKDNIVQHATINNLGLGRNIVEILRLVDAIQHHEQHGEVCPANWSAGEKAMLPNNQGLDEYFNQ